MKISFSKLFALYEIVMDFFGLLHKAEEVLNDQPTSKPQANTSLQSAGPPKDETDPDNKFNLNQ